MIEVASQRPEALIRFELPGDENDLGTDLRWVLLVDEPARTTLRFAKCVTGSKN